MNDSPELQKFVTPEPQRGCGGCTMCCKLMSVPELNKPAGTWCDEVRLTEGCAIFQSVDRPPSCRDFWCLWTLIPELPDVMRPDRSKVVLSITTNGSGVVAFVDPSRPDAFKEGRTGDYLLHLLHSGVPVAVVSGNKRTLYEPYREEAPDEKVSDN